MHIGTVQYSCLFKESPCSPVVTFPSFGSEGHGVQPPQGDSIFHICHISTSIMFFRTIFIWKFYLFAVQDLHRQHIFSLKWSKLYCLQKVITGIKRPQEPPKLNRLPITIQILVSIYNYFQPPQSYNLDYIMLWAVYTVAFFGLLRPSEFTCNSSSLDPTVHLCLRDVTFVPNTESPNHMLVSIKQSKTHPFRKGCTLPIARSTTSICSVMAMRDYLLQCKPAATDPLWPLSLCGCGCNILNSTATVSH